jgi:hypothetical protein
MKFRLKLRGRPAVAAAVAACALTVAAPTAMAQAPSVDLRSPDARDAAVAAEQAAQPAAGYSDLRSPDARDAAVAAQQAAKPAAGPTDLRSPDARDAARGVTTRSQSVPASRTVISVEEAGSRTLALVFSSVALLIALLAVGFVAVSRRPRPRWTAP